MRKENEKIVINIADDYSYFPIGRDRETNEYSGERFRDDLLVPPLRDNKIVEVDFDNIFACTPSFMDEAFGGLIRENKEDQDFLKIIKKHLIFKENDDAKYRGYNNLARKYMEKALTAPTLNNWVSKAENDDGAQSGVTSETAQKVKALEREVRELRQANEILRKASAYFAQAELGRPLKR